MNTVYKVVLEENGVLQSVNAMGSYKTEYIPGDRLYRKNLFVFTSLEDAERACWPGLGEQIWECETESDPRPAPPQVPDFEHTDTLEYMGIPSVWASLYIEEFWSDPYTVYTGPLRLMRPLRNSYLVDDVKLIRRLQCDE